MDFLEYLTEFGEDIKELYPNKDEHTIEEYLTTCAANPPTVEEFITPKCTADAEHFRRQGNKLYVIHEYKQAAVLYTKSLTKALPYSKFAALAYANRSAAFYNLKLYQECILDIDRALDLPYPEDLRGKIITRKEAAVGELKQNTGNETKEDLQVVESEHALGKGTKLPGASCGIDIAYNPQEGRKLIAKMPFQSGDILLVENPYLTVPEVNEEPTFCHHCLKTTLCLIPCEQCSEQVYCSEKCRREAYAMYHRVECKIQYTLTAAFPLNVQSIACQLRCLNIFTEQGTNLEGLYNDFKEVDENSDSACFDFTGDRYLGNTRKAFLSFLSGKKIKHDSRNWFEATYIVTLLRNYTDFFQKNKDVTIVAKLLIKLNLAYQLNHCPIPYAGKTDTKAHASFPLLGLAGHACVNNTITYIDNNGRIVLRASQFIRPGDEILYNYHGLQLSFAETMNRTGRTVQCKRVCNKCDKTYVYPPERQPRFKLDKRLLSKLQKNPYDIDGLWKLLNLVQGKHQHYTLQAQIIKTMIVDAYEGRGTLLGGHTQLTMFGIL